MLAPKKTHSWNKERASLREERMMEGDGAQEEFPTEDMMEEEEEVGQRTTSEQSEQGLLLNREIENTDQDGDSPMDGERMTVENIVNSHLQV